MNRSIVLFFATFSALYATPEGDYKYSYTYSNYVSYSSASSDPQCTGNCAIGVGAGIGGFVLLVCVCVCIKSCCEVCECCKKSNTVRAHERQTYNSSTSNVSSNTQHVVTDPSYNSCDQQPTLDQSYSYNSYISRNAELENEYSDYYV